MYFRTFFSNFQSFMIILWYLSIRFCRKKFSWSNTVFATWPQVRLVLTSEMPLSAYGLTFKDFDQSHMGLPDLNIICFKFSQILFNFLNSLIYWKIIKIFKYLACTCPAHFWSCMFQSKAKKIWWASSQNPKNRLRAIVAAGGGYAIETQIFLVE